MAARTTTVPDLIGLSDLRACTDVGGVYALFRKLLYAVESQSVAVPLDTGDLPGRLRDGVSERYLIAQVGGQRLGDATVNVTLFVLNDPSHASALIRGIAQTWTRRFPGQHLFVFANKDQAGQTGYRQITFVNARRLGEGAEVRIKLHKLVVDRLHATRHDLDTLNGIAVLAPGMTADALYKAQCAAFDVERMTDTFYREYARLFREAMERIKADNQGIATFYEQTRLHTFTQRLFGRLMFLYFLQKKEALNRDPNFITRWYDDAVRNGENFYGSVLEPLFFDTLNRPRDSHRSVKFGQVPYLNGGLFAADEDDHKGNVFLDNEIFDAKSEKGLLYFLNRHNFTVEEDTPLEVHVALDPEMLGKVFENLLETEERGRSGTFYTPRPVVAFMCREALASYLTAVEGLDTDRLGWLLDEAETGEPVRDEQGRERLTNASLTRTLRERIEKVLESVRVLDPAVGSGAFPLGMLALLVGVRRALYRMAGAEIAPQSHLVEGWKRNFIRDCLYGVDVRREAVEIARLRLWLSLVVDADPFDMEPLPNLDYKLMEGDSLIETFDGVAIYPTRPEDGPTQQSLLGSEETKRLIQQLHHVQDAFYQPEGSVDRASLKQRIRETEATLVEQALRERMDNENVRLRSVLQKLANLGGRPVPPALSAEQRELTRSIEVTSQALRDIKAGKPLPFFLYRLHFASVFAEKDGFDIVIANPPYVRHEKVPQETLVALKAAYSSVAHGMADLYVYFYARALQLLHDGGTLSFISSNKYFRAGYGKGLRDTLKDKSRVRLIIDFGDFPVFDAAAYPSIVVVDKGKPTDSHTYRSLTAGPAIQLEKLDHELVRDGQTLAQMDGVNPPSGAPATTALVAKLMAIGVPLRKFAGGRMYRGVVTGRNEAFVVDQVTRDRLIDEDQRSAEVLKPFLRGRDVGRYRAWSAGLWLIFTRRGIDMTRYPTIERYLSKFRVHLEPKATTDDGIGRKPGTYMWYEIQDSVDYYTAFEGPKIIYPDIAQRSEFAWDMSGSYLGNTNYFIPANDHYLCAVLNSRLMELVLASLSPQLRGGFYRYFSQYMEQLPIVEPLDSDKRRLESLVDQLQFLAGQGPQAEALEREVDEIVYRTYGLTRGEIAEIEHWHEERRALLRRNKTGKNSEREDYDD